MNISADEFAIRYSELSDDEQEILSEFMRRIEMGSEQYGPLDIDSDPRDFNEEEAQEQYDRVFYRLAEVIRRRRDGIR